MVKKILKKYLKNDECVMKNNFSRSTKWSKILFDYSACVSKNYFTFQGNFGSLGFKE